MPVQKLPTAKTSQRSPGFDQLEKIEPLGTAELGLEELAIARRNGDQKAEELFFRRIWKIAYSVARKGFNLGRHDAEDIAQTVCLIVVSRDSSIFNFSAWTFGTATFCCKTLIRNRSNAQRLLDENPYSLEKLTGDDEPGVNAEQLDLRVALEKLPSMQRAILWMRFALTMNWQQIDNALFDGEECSRYRASVATEWLRRRLRTPAVRAATR